MFVAAIEIGATGANPEVNLVREIAMAVLDTRSGATMSLGVGVVDRTRIAREFYARALPIYQKGHPDATDMRIQLTPIGFGFDREVRPFLNYVPYWAEHFNMLRSLDLTILHTNFVLDDVAIPSFEVYRRAGLKLNKVRSRLENVNATIEVFRRHMEKFTDV